MARSPHWKWFCVTLQGHFHRNPQGSIRSPPLFSKINSCLFLRSQYVQPLTTNTTINSIAWLIQPPIPITPHTPRPLIRSDHTQNLVSNLDFQHAFWPILDNIIVVSKSYTSFYPSEEYRCPPPLVSYCNPKDLCLHEAGPTIQSREAVLNRQLSHFDCGMATIVASTANMVTTTTPVFGMSWMEKQQGRTMITWQVRGLSAHLEYHNNKQRSSFIKDWWSFSWIEPWLATLGNMGGSCIISNFFFCISIQKVLDPYH